MIFVYKKWASFCSKLKDHNLISIPACNVFGNQSKYIVLKHDVEADVPKAYRMAQIEYKYGHLGSYYVQAYLMNNQDNIKLLKKMQAMGHEISYHYDVMDSCKGDIEAAVKELENNKRAFENSGFCIKTVCQHGNPVVERVGYTSNRDFFRSQIVQSRYPNIADIMVDFKKKAHTDYYYYSDTGRKFNLIYDPIDNDRINSDDRNIYYEDVDEVHSAVTASELPCIISTHPHRWTSSVVSYFIKAGIFKCIKSVAKVAMKIPGRRKIMSRYYYLAKKI
jgi:acyl-CoA synthetase (AMP-forming)/AMP-acid ligase II